MGRRTSKMNLDTTMSIDLDEVEAFVTSKKFTGFLVNNTSDLGIAAFILQTVMEKIDEYRSEQ